MDELRDIPDLQCPSSQYPCPLVLGQVGGGHSDFIWLPFALQTRGSWLLWHLVIIHHVLVVVRAIDTVRMGDLAISILPLLFATVTLGYLVR